MFGKSPLALQWVILVVISALLAAAFELLKLPSAPLLGPMAAAVVAGSFQTRIKVPRPVFMVAQSAIGCMIAASVPRGVWGEALKAWPLSLGIVFSAIGVSTALGWMLTRFEVLPGTTAVWGSSPGAATAMTLMSESYGADVRLVAFMQYLRVLLVAVVASIVARLWTEESIAGVSIDYFPAITWQPMLWAFGLMAVSVLIAHFWRIPAGPLLIPIVVGMGIEHAGVAEIDLPPWFLVCSYALVGWNIGLRFNRAILVHAARALPSVLASTFVLMAVCGGFAALLVVAAKVDPLTAYLATSPGGVDAAAIIAVSSKANVPFVMAMQTTRFILVLIIGPTLAAAIARRWQARQASQPS